MVTHELNYKTKTVTHLENKFIAVKGKAGVGRCINKEVEISIDTIPETKYVIGKTYCIAQITSLSTV